MRKWIHRALKGASLTTALFVFQACYGTPPGGFENLPPDEETELVEEESAVAQDGEEVALEEVVAE